MDENDQLKAAIPTKYGLFNPTILPVVFVWHTFQWCMEMVFLYMQWEILLIYLDDLIVFSDVELLMQKLILN